jgi:hypothetical protein
MNNCLEKMWMEAIIFEFEVLSKHLSGGTEERNEKPQLR